MMARCTTLVALALAISGCASGPKMYFERLDGQSIAKNPQLIRQFEVDKTVCEGESAKAWLTHRDVSPDEAVEAVRTGCMAQKGYLLRARSATPTPAVAPRQ